MGAPEATHHHLLILPCTGTQTHGWITRLEDAGELPHIPVVGELDGAREEALQHLLFLRRLWGFIVMRK